MRDGGREKTAESRKKSRISKNVAYVLNSEYIILEMVSETGAAK